MFQIEGGHARRQIQEPWIRRRAGAARFASGNDGTTSGEEFGTVRAQLDQVLSRDPAKLAYAEFQPYVIPSDQDATLLL